MAWNEPGGNGKDPWGGGRKNNDGPPDLDEALKKFQDKINGLFGGKSGKSGNGSSGGSSGFSFTIILGFAALLLVGYILLGGIYQLDEKQQAVVLRLGKFHSIVGPGLHWNPKIIDEVYPVNTTEERQYRTGGLMLTQDESIVELPVTVQYNIQDIQAFVLNVKSPEDSLKQATDSALRHVVGSTELNQVLSEGRAKISREMTERLQLYLNSYGTGIKVVGVNIQEGKPPAAVKDAFDDVVKAKEDQESLKAQAQSYANGIVPEARGRAQRTLDEASAYRDQVIAKAEGEAQRFSKLLVEYSKAPEVTRERLYIDAIESVMANSSKVMVDVEGGNNMMYLPLDKIIGSGGNTTTTLSRTGSSDLSAEILREINNRVAEEVRNSQSGRTTRGLR